MESCIQKKLGQPLFRIILQKLPEDAPRMEVGTAKYNINRCFTIYYHPGMEKKELRICLAHELGHLFCAVLLDKDNSKKFCSEPVSTVFGIFAILDKNDFYTNKTKSFCHPSPEAIVDSFCLMNNHKKGIYNRS
ncbi:hypothetical protein P0082_00960 [Candidatus Haliotispira prima]|uniref:IrrE N-terminal-like domain-containing protein n=1 Tax=Candidatus Haliotispira prima TaxID=3034016 RepID=A0ABY8MJT4_9SPIO|nr:hypothetical protein P0082_00960 [Candidatus Haliotispira prima]